MNPQPEPDLEHRQPPLEAEINSPLPSAVPQSEKPSQAQTDNSQILQVQSNAFITWFNGLSGLGKLLVLGVVAMIGLFVLRTVLKLVSAVITVMVLAVLLYMGYEFFIARKWRN